MYPADHGEDAPGKEKIFFFSTSTFFDEEEERKKPKNEKKLKPFFKKQIRAQMATFGFPLLGDVLYGTGDYSRVENPNSHEERRRKKEWRSNNGGVVVAVEGEAKDKKEKNPPPLPLDRPIALHAARLASSGRHALKVFGRDPAVFDAGAPWWRAGLGEEDERDLEKALKLRAEMEAEAEAAAARGGEESGSEGGEGEGEPVMLEA